jgi:hypothetical protein
MMSNPAPIEAELMSSPCALDLHHELEASSLVNTANLAPPLTQHSMQPSWEQQSLGAVRCCYSCGQACSCPC